MSTVTLPVAAKPSQVLAELKHVFGELGWTVVTASGPNMLQAHRPMTIWSWGDRIQAQAFAQVPDCLLVLSSTPRMQLANWGQDDRNLQAIIAALFARLGQVPHRTP